MCEEQPQSPHFERELCYSHYLTKKKRIKKKNAHTHTHTYDQWQEGDHCIVTEFNSKITKTIKEGLMEKLCQHHIWHHLCTTCAGSSVHTAECGTNLARVKKNPMQSLLFHREVNGRAEWKAARGQASAPIHGNCVQLWRMWVAFTKVIRHRPWPFLNHPRETLEEEGYIFCPYSSGEFL